MALNASISARTPAQTASSTMAAASSTTMAAASSTTMAATSSTTMAATSTSASTSTSSGISNTSTFSSSETSAATSTEANALSAVVPTNSSENKWTVKVTGLSSGNTSVLASTDVSTSADSSTVYTTVSGSLESSTNAFANQTEVTKVTVGDCSKVIGVSVTVAVIVWAVTVVLFLICLLKMRQKWRRKLLDERHKTDIWSLSTYHNTIINENFLDYRLAPSTRGHRNSDAMYNTHTARLKQGRLSGGALSRASSQFNDDYTFRQSIIRRGTMSDDERSRFARSKTRAKRQSSNYSSDYMQEQSGDFRPRTSTFNVGKRDKHDKHVLVNHDELRMTGSRSFDGLDMLERRSRESVAAQEKSYYVTEL